MKVVIMAGGMGTRMSSVTSEIPKPMTKVVGKPILEHQIDCLKRQGLTDIIIVTGYLGDVIRNYFSDGTDFGVDITYFNETLPLGTAGALVHLKDQLTDDFFLINGDLFFDIDFERFLKFHQGKKSLATLFTHPNDHPYDSAIIEANSEFKITNWLHKEDRRNFCKNRVNAGIHILSPRLFDQFLPGTKMDLDRDVLKPLIYKNDFYVYDSPEYVKDMGTPERHKEICNDVMTGLVKSRNLKEKQKAIFIDRDGTINEYCGAITELEQLQLINGAADAISRINKSGYLAILITNQPVIAKGKCSLEQLENIHNKLEFLLGEQGAYLDAIYFCPHHPDKGFEGERIEYKIECDCRKPKPGLITKASMDYNINLAESYMVGDSPIDVMAGQAAGCRAVLLSKDRKTDLPIEATVCSSLFDFVDSFLDN